MNDSEVKPETLYGEAAASYRYIVDWRYKILTRYFITSTAFILAAKWMGEAIPENRTWLVGGPLVFGTISCFIFYAMDRRNKKMIDACSAVAANLENPTGVYSEWCSLSKSKWPPSYDAILAFIYLGSAVAFAIAAVVVPRLFIQ